MDYKSTLNLPKTAFSMKADLVHREPARLERWEKQRLYYKIQENRKGRPRFVLHDGPPFANGDVHIGTALNKILKDFIVKYKTLRGFYAPFIPGWDCHGLPIEFKVSQDLEKTAKNHYDHVLIRKECEKYALRFVEIQRKQFKRLGVFGDWENPYLTLDPCYEAEELRLLADLIEKGYIYRGKKPVYWSIPCRTALAEAEVEYREKVSPSIYVKFPVVGEKDTYILIWTTTPWTLPANLAVAYNSTFFYSAVRVGAEVYILSSILINDIAAKCRWESWEIVRSLSGEVLSQLEYLHPFCNRIGKLYPGDEFVDSQTGTGFVHIAPGHGLEDYILGCQVGLPIYSPIDDEGRFIYTNDLPKEQQFPSYMLGKAILGPGGNNEANNVVIEELKKRNLLLYEEEITHSYPHCWRSKTPVIFRALEQWFIKIDHIESEESEIHGAKTLRERALQEIQTVRWIPIWGKSRIEGAVASRPDWCISRQRAWGVPIPAFYTDKGEPILTAYIVRKVADLVEKHGSSIWFELPVQELWKKVKPIDWNGPEPVTKSTETLDVWIDSGCSSRAVLMRRSELRAHTSGAWDWRADVYLEGSDQHRGWFQSSLLLSLAVNRSAPFKCVITHGFMVDVDREKISKSRQNPGGYEKPQTAEAYVSEWGADILRLWVASQDYRGDIVVSEDRIAKVAESYRLLRNTLRFQLGNLYDFNPSVHAISDEKLTSLDRWILGRLYQIENEIIEAYEEYEFHLVYQKIVQFASVDLSALYHDVIKDRLYTEHPNSYKRRSSQTALYRLLLSLTQLLSPILVFTSDEVWEYIPEVKLNSVHESEWSHYGLKLLPEEEKFWNTVTQIRERALPKLEELRRNKIIGPNLEAKVKVFLPPNWWEAVATEESTEIIREFLNVSQLELLKDTNITSPIIEATKASGNKCSRCWRWDEGVGKDTHYPDICLRCAEVIRRLTENESSQ